MSFGRGCFASHTLGGVRPCRYSGLPSAIDALVGASSSLRSDHIIPSFIRKVLQMSGPAQQLFELDLWMVSYFPYPPLNGLRRSGECRKVGQENDSPCQQIIKWLIFHWLKYKSIPVFQNTSPSSTSRKGLFRRLLGPA